MTKIINITPTPKEYSDTGLFKESAETFSVNNTGTQRVTLSDISSDNALFTAGTFQANVEPFMPIDSTVYFVNATSNIQNTDGSYETTDQGFGQAGTTDSDGKLTVTGLPAKSVIMTTPVLTAGVEGDITGTSLFVTTVNVYYRLSTDTLWTEFNFGITVIANAWTATGTMPAAGTYDFLVTDADCPTVRDQLDDVNVISSVTYYSMSGGYQHSLGIIDGVAYSWGWGTSGQLGRAVTEDKIPLAVTASGVLNGKTIAKVAAGHLHSLALDTDGKVYAWGDNASGQLGDNSTTRRDAPVAVDTSGVLNGKTITQIAAGYDYSLALDSDGKVYAWGARGYSSSVPVAVDTSGVLNGKTITSIKVSANAYHAVMLDSDGVVYTMGWNSYGQLGDNSTTDSYAVPVAVDTSGVLSGKTITAIGCGAFNSYAIDSAGKVYSWGKNNRGECGDNTTTTPRMVPVAVYSAGVLSGKTIEFVSGGFSVTVQDSDGKLYSWGDGSLGGALGDGTQTHNQKTPVAVDMTDVLSGKTIVSYSVGTGYVLAVGDDNIFYGWGYNHWGMLGDDTQVNKTVPMIVDVSGV